MSDLPPGVTLEDPSGSANGAVDWQTDKQGRQYVGAKGRSGVVYRQGEESIDDAHARDAEGPKKRPPKAKARRKPVAPTTVTMQELEHGLIDALRAPAFIAAMNGDDWGAQHFTTQAPIVARNLVKCSEHNPWLREKLLAIATGEGPLMNLMMYASLGAAIFGYVVPPIVYYLNPGIVPETARLMVREKYQIPEPPTEEELRVAAEASAFAAAAAAPAGA